MRHKQAIAFEHLQEMFCESAVARLPSEVQVEGSKLFEKGLLVEAIFDEFVSLPQVRTFEIEDRFPQVEPFSHQCVICHVVSFHVCVSKS